MFDGNLYLDGSYSRRAVQKLRAGKIYNWLFEEQPQWRF